MFKCVLDSSSKALLLGVQLERGADSAGFTQCEEMLLSLLCAFLGSKLRSLSSLKKAQYFSTQTFDFPKIIMKLICSRSLTELIAIINDSLPKSFGFEHAELILSNPKSTLFLTQ